MNSFLRFFRANLIRRKDPFDKPSFDFLKLKRDDFLFALVERRQVYDGRLRGENLNNWPMFRFTFASPDGSGPFELAPLAHAPHHALKPFVVRSKLASGELAIVDTPDGERFRLSLSKASKALQATVIIDRVKAKEKLVLKANKDSNIYESSVAPAEPHEFTARLVLKSQ